MPDHSMSLQRGLASVAACLALIACSDLQVSVDYDPSSRLSTLHTYRWKPDPQQKSGDTLVDTDTLLHQRVIGAIDSELARKGLKKVALKPDFLVTFYFTRQRNADESTFSYPFYGGYFGGPYYGYWGSWYYPGYIGYGGNYARGYEEGLLAIDLVDPSSNKLLWRGKVKDIIRFQEAPESRTRRIQQAVSALLEQFPPH